MRFATNRAELRIAYCVLRASDVWLVEPTDCLLNYLLPIACLQSLRAITRYPASLTYDAIRNFSQDRLQWNAPLVVHFLPRKLALAQQPAHILGVVSQYLGGLRDREQGLVQVDRFRAPDVGQGRGESSVALRGQSDGDRVAHVKRFVALAVE